MPIQLTDMSIKDLGVCYKAELYQCLSVFAVIRLNISVNSGQNFVVLFADKISASILFILTLYIRV